MKRSSLESLEVLQRSSLSFLLIRCGHLLDDRGMKALHAAAPDAPKMREAHSRLVPHLQRPEGIRITELAALVGVSKQAVHQLVSELAEFGIVRFDEDPDDARARRVKLTARGINAMLQGTWVLKGLDVEVSERVGKAQAKRLHRLLTKLSDSLTSGA